VARELTDDQHEVLADKLEQHVEAVLAGEDPAVVDGLPWWFGPDYHPDELAIDSFAAPPEASTT
jgi:hypothetical protein